ncbi:TonB-dependent receptor [Nitrospirillum amazonense]|uniref:TonB-dependent receptor n=1 Tax=Nitrospirillum amazonense TaxID=28077 RepID=UPI002DD444A9|nr:TonB-dependent receptor [Nitrospirillum amazonense]MEC4590176.1 TonB-dependent receptor [Nitrospirillum amazonense]
MAFHHRKMVVGRLPRSLIVGTALAGLLAMGGTARAQAPAQAPAGPAQAQAQVQLPAQPLAASLEALSRQTDTNILFAPDMVAGRTAPAVDGRMSVWDAVVRLLAGSGLEVVPDAGGGLVVRKAVPHAAAGEAAQYAAADLTEILVTAQRREEKLQDVPVAVTALPAKALRDQRITNLQDVSRVTPGLLVSSFNYSSPTIAIRGASNTFTQIGVNRPVAVVLDDVFITRSSAAMFDLFDLDSVQVLRGPQGTLFGRNVTGGAILLNTRKPSFTTPEGSVSVGYGNYNAVDLNALVSGPVSDDVAAKLVVSRRSHDGYGEDRLTGRAEDDLDSTSVRGQLRARAGRVQTLFTLDYSDDHNGGRTLSSLGGGNDGNPRTSELGFPQSFTRHMAGFANNTEIDVGQGTVTAITAYRLSRSVERYSSTGTNYAFLTTGSQQMNDDADDVKDFSEEVRYTSPEWDLGNFVAGVYYLNEDASRQLGTRNFAARTGALTTNQLANQSVGTDSISGFLDGTVNLPADVKLTLGGRYTLDQKRGNLVRTNYLVPAAGFRTGDLDSAWAQFTPRVVLSWRPIPDTMLYASVAKGFTSGGYNTEASSLAAIVTPFNPEKVTNYEVGAKTGWWDQRLTANLSLFHLDYRDKQEFVQNTVTGIGTILNAAKATSEGAELELGLHPVQGLDLTAAYSYLDTAYDDFFIAKVVNNTGHPLGSSPKHKVALTANYETPVGTLGFLSGNVSYSWLDDYYTGATKSPQLFVPAYDLVNASLSFETPDRRYRLTLWGKNLFDTAFLQTPSTAGVLSEYLGPPRTYGFTLSASF